MTFLVCASSDAFSWLRWRGVYLSPLAGGRSPNSTAKIDSNMERFSEGTPAAMMIALELSPPLGGNNMGWQAAADGWVSASS